VKNKNIIFVLVVITISVLILGLMVLFIVLDKKDFSDTENRNLAKFPEFSFERLMAGEFIKELEIYFSDHFPFRNQLMSFKTSFLKTIGQDKIDELYIGKDGYLLEEYNITPKKTNIPIQSLNNFYNALPKETNVGLMLVPNSVEIYKEKLPKYSINNSQKDVIDYVYKNLEFNTINVYKYLEEAKSGVDSYSKVSRLEYEYCNNFEKDFSLYYKTDHHWTTFGAYLGYIAYMDSLENNVFAKVEFEKITDDFYGTFYSKLVDNSLEKESMYKLKDEEIEYSVKNVSRNKITNTLYESEWLDKKDKYSYFLGQNEALIEIENNSVQNDKKILIIKDSYGNSFVPFIARDYKYVYVIDPRLYRLKISDYIKENSINEVLLIYNMKTVETDLGIRVLR